MAEALIGLLAMMLLAFVRIPIALAMGIVGIVGYAYMRDWTWGAAFATAQTKIYETGRNYTLSVVPLFILMGNFVTRAGMSQELFKTAYAFIGHLRQGRVPVDETLRVCRLPLDRRNRRGRHAGHPDPALHHHGDLRHHDRDQHRQAVRRRRAARDPGDAAAVPRGAVHDLARSEGRAARRAH